MFDKLIPPQTFTEAGNTVVISVDEEALSVSANVTKGGKPVLTITAWPLNEFDEHNGIVGLLESALHHLPRLGLSNSLVAQVVAQLGALASRLFMKKLTGG